MAVKAVIFDYGGLLTTPVRVSIEAWLTADQIDPESFSTALKAWLGRDVPVGTPIHRLETGELTIAEFNQLFAAELRRHDGTPVSPDGLLAKLFAPMRPDPVMFDLARELVVGGVCIAVLSNSWGDTYPCDEVTRVCDTIVISGEVGLRKPDAAIYELTLDRLGLDASDADESSTSPAPARWATVGKRTTPRRKPACRASPLADQERDRVSDILRLPDPADGNLSEYSYAPAASGRIRVVVSVAHVGP